MKQLLILFLSITSSAFALDPEPRTWSHLPINTNFIGVGYAYTEADILLAPATRLDDVKMTLQTTAIKYIRTFEFLDTSARIDLTQAYQEGEWTGRVNGKEASTSRSGLSDAFVRLAVNLYGAPPLEIKDFVAYKSKQKSQTIIGTALALRLPTGDYQEDKLINLGKNRFAIRPQLGITHVRGKWSVEATGQVAFYTDNDDFFNGNKLEQKPLYIAHAHLIHTFKPGLWASASIGYDYGGETTVNGVDKDDTNEDIAYKLSIAYPISSALGFKLSYIGTQTQADTGFNSNTVSASLSFMW